MSKKQEVVSIEELYRLVEETINSSTGISKNLIKNRIHTDENNRVIKEFIKYFEISAGTKKVKNNVIRHLYMDVFVPKFPHLKKLKDRAFFILLSQVLPKGRYNDVRYYLLNKDFKDEETAIKNRTSSIKQDL